MSGEARNVNRTSLDVSSPANERTTSSLVRGSKPTEHHASSPFASLSEKGVMRTCEPRPIETHEWPLLTARDVPRFFFSNLKSAFPCFRTRDPWKQTPQHSSCRRKILTSDQAFSFVVRVTRDERSDRACLVCAHHATHTRALQRNRHARTWNPNSRCLNRFMEKRVIFWCTMLTRIIMVFFFFLM